MAEDLSGLRRQGVTGIVLAGGRGSRMGGVDKGLQVYRGRPLVQHAIDRLRPQVEQLLISANRNLPEYARLGACVHADADPGFAGPLAGFAAGLAHCTTAWLATVPCDSPALPLDLVARLHDGALAHGADLAVAAAPEEEGGSCRVQPVFCLVHRRLLPDLASYLKDGERRVGAWIERHRSVRVRFDAPEAFRNINTLTQLRGLDGGGSA